MKKIILVCSIVAMLLLVSGVVYANSLMPDEENISNATDELNTPSGEEVINEETTENETEVDWVALVETVTSLSVVGPSAVLDDPAEIVDSAEEADAILSEYEDVVDSVFTESGGADYLDSFRSYTEEVENREEIIEDSSTALFEVIDYGNFEVEIVEYNISGSNAEVYALISSWQKIVMQDESDNSIFGVGFPVCKVIKKFNFILDGEDWKYDSFDVVSAYAMSEDDSLYKEEANYEDAVAYAVSVTPSNVLADEDIEIISDGDLYTAH